MEGNLYLYFYWTFKWVSACVRWLACLSGRALSLIGTALILLTFFPLAKSLELIFLVSLMDTKVYTAMQPPLFL